MEEPQVPSLVINQPPAISTPENQLVPDEKVINLQENILDNIEEDREQVSDAYETFYDMVINGGEASSASKEALVNLLRLKTEMTDKKIKVMEQWMKLKMREKDNIQFRTVANQKNFIYNNSDKKAWLEEANEESK